MTKAPLRVAREMLGCSAGLARPSSAQGDCGRDRRGAGAAVEGKRARWPDALQSAVKLQLVVGVLCEMALAGSTGRKGGLCGGAVRPCLSQLIKYCTTPKTACEKEGFDKIAAPAVFPAMAGAEATPSYVRRLLQSSIANLACPSPPALFACDLRHAVWLRAIWWMRGTWTRPRCPQLPHGLGFNRQLASQSIHQRC